MDQNSRIFFLGVLCIVLGAGVIGVTMYFLYNPAHDAGASQPSDKYVLGLVGVIGSLLTNYVAAIFLKMHAAVTTSLVDLHAKLVHTHELFLANLLAARIQVDQQRQEAFAKLALAIVGYKEQ